MRLCIAPDVRAYQQLHANKPGSVPIYKAGVALRNCLNTTQHFVKIPENKNDTKFT